MAAMPRDPVQPQLPNWDEEEAKQKEIAEQIASDAPVKSSPQVAGTDSDEETTVDEVVEEQPLVEIRAYGDDVTYPLTVTVVGAPEEGFVFESEGDTIEVEPQVAEQVTYLPNVEVVS